MIRFGMRRAALVLIAVATVCAAAVAVGRATGRQSAREFKLVEIVSSSPENLGEIPVSSEAIREVVIRNVISGPVVLTVKGTNCGCLAAAFDKERLEPGESAVFRLVSEVRPEQMEQRLAAWIEARPESLSTVVQKMVVSVRFSAAVEYYVYPRGLVVHQEPDAVGAASFIIRPYGVETISLISAESSAPESIQIESRRTRFGDREGISVDVTTRFPERGSHFAQVRVRTDCPSYPEFVLPIHVRVGVGAVGFETVVLNGADGAPQATATIHPNVTDAETWSGFRFEPDISGLIAQVVVEEATKSVRIHADFAIIQEPAGSTDLVLTSDGGQEIQRHRVVWIGPLERLKVTTGASEATDGLPASLPD